MHRISRCAACAGAELRQAPPVRVVRVTVVPRPVAAVRANALCVRPSGLCLFATGRGAGGGIRLLPLGRGSEGFKGFVQERMRIIFNTHLLHSFDGISDLLQLIHPSWLLVCKNPAPFARARSSQALGPSVSTRSYVQCRAGGGVAIGSVTWRFRPSFCEC